MFVLTARFRAAKGKMPHIKELVSKISNYIEGDLELTEYEFVQVD